MNCKALAVSKSGRTLKTLLTAIVVFASMITGMAQVPSYVSSNGLVGWWPFNGNANDESGNGNNGTVFGSLLSNDRFGNINSSYSFDGNNNYINIGSNILFTNEYTFSAWVYIDSSIIKPRSVIISKLQSTGVYQYKGSELNINNEQHFLTIQGNDTLYNYFEDTTNIVSLNQWTHIIATYDGQFIRHYVNGNIIDSTTAYYLADSIGNPVFIGARPFDTNGPYWFMNGIIDDIGIWNRALTQQEITNLYTSSTPPPCNPLAANLQSGLVGYWPFCGNANDESGNGNNGTVNGATLTTDRFGAANSAYSFDPVNISHILVPFSNSLNSIQNGITISAWIYMDGGTGPATPPRILELRGAYGNGGDAGFVILAKDSSNVSRNFEMRFYNNNGNSDVNIPTTGSSLSALSWHNIIFTGDGTTGIAKYYFDGVFIDSLVQNIVVGCNYNNNPLYIGSESTLLGNWGGNLDDIGIWNRPLTQNEITQLYTGSPLSVVSPDYQNTIKVYPNPSSSQITIDFGANFNTLAGYTMRIQNAVGQTVYTTGVSQQQFTSNLNTWTGSGIYFVYLIDAQGNTVDVKKIILQ
jgi:hypothetical protein